MDAMMEEANNSSVRFEIFDQLFNLDGDDLEYGNILELAEYVDSKMREIADKTPGADSARVAMIAALEIADDYHRVKTELDGRVTEEARQHTRERRQRHYTRRSYERQLLAIMNDESVPAKERRGALFALGRSRGYQRQPTAKR
jgi:cell division protein ZapA